MRYLTVKVLPVVAALLLLAVATPANAGQGWYLLQPPPFSDGTDLPLRQWDHIGGYDWAADCEKGRDAYLRNIQKDVRPDFTADKDSFVIMRWSIAAACISAGDPRLVSAPTARPPKAAAAPGLTYAPPSTPKPPKVAAAPPQRLTITPDAPPQQGKPPGLTYYDTKEESEGIIRYTPGRPIIVTVKLNGRTTVRLVLDTGADGSMVKPDLLAAAGVDLSRPAARGKASGIDSTVKVSYFAVDFEIAGHRVRVPRVAAFDTYDDGFADGLLGRDFLDRFKVVMDPAAGTVTLVPR